MKDGIIHSEVKEYGTSDIINLYRAMHGQVNTLSPKECRFFQLLREAERQHGSIRTRVALVLDYATDLVGEERTEARAWLITKMLGE